MSSEQSSDGQPLFSAAETGTAFESSFTSNNDVTQEQSSVAASLEQSVQHQPLFCIAQAATDFGYTSASNNDVTQDQKSSVAASLIDLTRSEPSPAAPSQYNSLLPVTAETAFFGMGSGTTSSSWAVSLSSEPETQAPRLNNQLTAESGCSLPNETFMAPSGSDQHQPGFDCVQNTVTGDSGYVPNPNASEPVHLAPSPSPMYIPATPFPSGSITLSPSTGLPVIQAPMAPSPPPQTAAAGHGYSGSGNNVNTEMAALNAGQGGGTSSVAPPPDAQPFLSPEDRRKREEEATREREAAKEVALPRWQEGKPVQPTVGFPADVEPNSIQLPVAAALTGQAPVPPPPPPPPNGGSAAPTPGDASWTSTSHGASLARAPVSLDAAPAPQPSRLVGFAAVVANQKASATARGNNRRTLSDRDRFLIFMKVLMKCIEAAENQQLKLQAKCILMECTRRNRMGDTDYSPLMDAVERRLRGIVGESYWLRAEQYVDRYCEQRRVQMSATTVVLV